MKLAFIINEQAGNGKGKRIWQKMSRQLTTPYTAFKTSSTGHASFIAKDIAEKQEETLIVVIGGDGTIHEVANSCIHAKWLTIGCLKAGSGNDFGRAFYAFESATDIERFMQQPKIDVIDTGKISDRYFINNCGIGFDAYISTVVNTSRVKKWLNKIRLGKLSYTYYVILGLLTFKTFTLQIKTGDDTQTFRDVWFATVSNQPYFGGGMKISPTSKATDGQLELTVVHNLPKLKFLLMFGSVFFGAHTRFKEVKQLTSNEFEWTIDYALPCHTDGEHFVMHPSKSQIQVVPASLSVAKK